MLNTFSLPNLAIILYTQNNIIHPALFSESWESGRAELRFGFQLGCASQKNYLERLMNGIIKFYWPTISGFSLNELA
jgi:hypothetical protein